jgi:hypothetical protein
MNVMMVTKDQEMVVDQIVDKKEVIHAVEVAQQD